MIGRVYVAATERKAPVCPHTGAYASVSDPATWGTLEQARVAQRRWGLPHVGFVLTADDGLAVLDLDAPVTPPQQRLHGQIREAFADTYQEWSQSRRGVHVVCLGSVPGGGFKSGAHKVEAYSQERYVIVTGWHVEGTAREVTDCGGRAQGLLESLLTTLRPPRRPVARRLSPMADSLLLKLLFRSGRMALLHRGHWERHYGSQSDADFALCCALARHSNDPDQIARLLSQSPLGERDKVQRRPDYAIRTARAALQRTGGST